MGHTAFRSTRLLERNQTDFVAINLRCGRSGGKSLFAPAAFGADFSIRVVLRLPRDDSPRAKALSPAARCAALGSLLPACENCDNLVFQMKVGRRPAGRSGRLNS
jgi:hypothetical protein